MWSAPPILATSKGALELPAAWPFVWAALGIHPESLIEEDASTNTQFSGDWKAELAAIAPLLAEKKAVAVGEIGLDYHWPIPKDAQLELFEAQIRLALELDKPVIVHDRGGPRRHLRTFKKIPPQRGAPLLFRLGGGRRLLTAQGLYIGFGGAATFRGQAAVKAAAIVPPDKLLVETDCPYMAPEPCRGRRCDSSLIAHTAAFLAGVRGEETERLLETTCQNARALFGLG